MSANNQVPQDTRIGWDDKTILTAAGRTLAGIKSVLSESNQPTPSDDACYQMISRERIPDRWRAPLIYALARKGSLTLANLFRVIDNAGDKE